MKLSTLHPKNKPATPPVYTETERIIVTFIKKTKNFIIHKFLQLAYPVGPQIQI